MVPNNSAARLFIFKVFSLPTRLIWTYTVINFSIIFLPTCLLSTIFYYFFLFSILFIIIFHYNWFYKALFYCIFIILLLSILKRSKFHIKSEYTYVKVLRKFLPTRLLGPTRLLNFRLFSHLHGYLDSTLIRHHKVISILKRIGSIQLVKNRLIGLERCWRSWIFVVVST